MRAGQLCLQASPSWSRAAAEPVNWPGTGSFATTTLIGAQCVRHCYSSATWLCRWHRHLNRQATGCISTVSQNDSPFACHLAREQPGTMPCPWPGYGQAAGASRQHERMAPNSEARRALTGNSRTARRRERPTQRRGESIGARDRPPARRNTRAMSPGCAPILKSRCGTLHSCTGKPTFCARWHCH
jgi:hypothetical protein